MKKLSIWTRYGELGASSRLRFYNYLPALTAAGWQPEIYNFFDDRYLQDLYSGKGKNIFKLFPAWACRLEEMNRCASGIPALIEYELLPYLPFAAEKNFLSNRKYVLNFDDNVFLRYRKLPLLKNKYENLLKKSAGVIAANDFLLDIIKPYNSNCCKLPTVPPPRIQNAEPKADRFTILWLGTPVTFPFLYEKRETLRIAAEKCNFELLIVGGSAVLPGVNCQLIPWSETAEIQALQRAHIGVMPLPQTPFACGKSAYKLIRYLQYGLPAVASPVGENKIVLQHGKTGFLAESDSEWITALCRLADPECRKNMYHAISAAAEKYSLANGAEILTRFLEKTFREN